MAFFLDTGTIPSFEQLANLDEKSLGNISLGNISLSNNELTGEFCCFERGEQVRMSLDFGFAFWGEGASRSGRRIFLRLFICLFFFI